MGNKIRTYCNGSSLIEVRLYPYFFKISSTTLPASGDSSTMCFSANVALISRAMERMGSGSSSIESSGTGKPKTS